MRSKSSRLNQRFIITNKQTDRSTKNSKSRPFKNALARDLFAMQQVWQMLKEGTIRFVGEIGRQY